MATYREFKFWSPVYGGEAARLSMVNERNAEFFMIVPTQGGGRIWREDRARALEAIGTAIDMGLEPGEVRVG